ncbi:MAG: BREX-1 system adenine-specific DNA-methyltransferase PglX [Spirochaetia bacterium]|nr:BREX-1 system adenine-specific DNA-methyltransferase PglX [Spirochaetia bacterium]
MAKNTDEKLNIQEAIKAFAKDDVSKAGINLFSVLGYDTSLQAPLDNKTYEEFKENYIDASPAADRFSEEKALTDNWKTIDILFQLTDESFSGTKSLFEESVNPTDIQSYLIFAVELKNQDYTRTQLAEITREINKIFPIPILIIFKCLNFITLAVINRRPSKKDSERDVLEKVTLIKDININKPHRAHIEILNDLIFANLQRTYKVRDFMSLHKAWSEVLDTQTLNQRFYNELSHWYFWAQTVCQFPGADEEAERGSLFVSPDKLAEHNAKNLIRLISRLLFIWFIKEKDLVPDEIFDKDIIKEKYLKNFNPQGEETIYYKAILQNLFFAVLNQEINSRKFRREGDQMGIDNLMRYEAFFKTPEAAQSFLSLMKDTVPFMNGGLFECLDETRQEENKQGKIVNKKYYYDGFSDRTDVNLNMPDYLFFSEEQTVDLSKFYEGDEKKKNKKVIVHGLISIFKNYKFTIAENTPVEQDIALDPELLGRVFENLLASYNPETKTSARKGTGSYYTPREIVNFMVDETVKEFLLKKLIVANPRNANVSELKMKLENLVGYYTEDIQVTEEEKEIIVKAINECKVLDPACGSGAFPMGILQKLVYILHKLDPDNSIWKRTQVEKIQKQMSTLMMNVDNKTERQEALEEINNRFDENMAYPDYARKLYLIENCIYGIDIQPIAIQISKLRCFISLVVDETVDPTKENFGIIPLPNLESKFVSANTLVDLRTKDDSKSLFYNKKIEDLREKLENIRHSLYTVRSLKTKNKRKEEYKETCAQIVEILKQDGWGSEIAIKLAAWNPFSKNTSSKWFDAEWMFDVDNGFDIVIGNPPYMRVQEIQNTQPESKLYYEKRYPASTGGGAYDLANVFFERAIELVKENGVCSYIFPHKFLNTDGSASFRDWLREGTYIKKITHFGANQIFKDVNTYTCVVQFTKSKGDGFDLYKAPFKSDYLADMVKPENYSHITYDMISEASKLYGKNNWIMFTNPEHFKVFEKIHGGKRLRDILADLFVGLQTSKDDLYVLEKNEDGSFTVSLTESTYKLEPYFFKPFLKGKDVQKWSHLETDKYVFFPYKLHDDMAEPVSLTELKNKYPLTYKYVMDNEKEFKKRESGKGGKLPCWYAYIYPKNLTKFEQLKLTSMEICADHPNVTMNRDNLYHTTKAYSWVKRADVKEPYEYLLAIANSPVIWWFLKLTGDTLQGDARTFKTEYLNPFPLPEKVSKEDENKIVTAVNEILSIKEKDPDADVSEKENVLNQMVYALYGLDGNDVKIIESANRM